MSIYRRHLRSGKRCKYYCAEFTYRGKVHRRNGLPDRETARHWIASEQLRLRRGAVGFVKPAFAAQVIPLADAYAEHLKSRQRDPMYSYTTGKRLKRLAGECGWLTLAHVTRDSLEQWLAGTSLWRKRGIGNRTKNQYLDTAREWGAWLVRQGKLPANPFDGVERLPARHNDDYRRAATVDELNRLLAVCSPARRLYYLFRIYCPLRGKTIARLTWRMMHLDSNPPYCETPSEINKSRKAEKHAIRYEVAQELRAERKRRKGKADDVVFGSAPVLSEFRADLVAADVAVDAGNSKTGRLDFHALRASLVSIARAAGLTEFQAAEILGHRDVRTTMKYYRKASLPKERGQAVERLPALGAVRRAQ